MSRIDAMVDRDDVVPQETAAAQEPCLPAQTYETAVELQGINLTFNARGNSVHALENVDLKIAAQEFVAIIGPSGCGKSTLLRIIAGLLGPTSGSIKINGVASPSPGRDRGFVFQTSALLPWKRVRENVALGLQLAGVPTAKATDIVRRYLALVGLSDFADHYPHELSGGMKQRANLARALAVDPSVLLMDEPFAALDAQTREIMQTELLRIWQQGSKSVLFVTHQIDEAVFLADRVLVMSARPGKIVEEHVVPFARPRDPGLAYSDAFTEIKRPIWERLRSEVLRARALSGDARQ